MPHRHFSSILSWWVGHVERHYRVVIILFTLVTLAILAYTVKNFKINDDLTSMISDKLPFRHLEKEFYREFPQTTDVIVLVVDSDSIGSAMDARRRLAERLRKEKNLFNSVYEPGGGEFFERNGLLYMEPHELDELSDNLAQGEPMMGLLFRDFSLRGFFSLIGTVLDNYGSDPSGKMDTMLDHVGTAFRSAAVNRPYHLPWESMMYGEKEAADQRKQFIIVHPHLDQDGLLMGTPPPDAMHRIIGELKFDDSVKVRMTGDVLLAYEDVTTVRESVGLATFASLILVGAIILFALGSIRLVFVSLATLLTGLIWTTAFGLAVDCLNLISVTFAVLFVGLGIDYSIQFCLRYRELVEAGHDNRESIIRTAGGVGTGLFISCITTAFGFYAFLPTAYAGIAQLGLISGTGMFIGFFCNLTLLPALLTLIGFRKGMISPLTRKISFKTRFPYKHYRGVCVAALALGLCAAALLPGVYFDYNPLNLYNPASESISTLKELFTNRQAPPWTISILTDGKKSADELADRIGKLKEVKAAISIVDFVPTDQEEKQNILSNMALFMAVPENLSVKSLPYGDNMAALNSLETKLEKFIAGHPGEPARRMTGLLDSLRQFKKNAATPGRGKAAFASLEDGLVAGLPPLLTRLDKMLHPATVTYADLPPDLVREYVSPAGRYRVQVMPREDMMNVAALGRFVKAVEAVAPNATDTPVSIYETGKAVVSSFRLATMMALAVVLVVLLGSLRSFSAAALVLIPLFLAITLAAATSVICGLPLNFANVIVLPLFLGVGVHSGVMFILRYLTEPPADGNMLMTSTARAVFYSNLTMIISTSTLAFSAHRGIASMGKLLTLCFVFIMICILIVFPALLQLFVKYREGKQRASG